MSLEKPLLEHYKNIRYCSFFSAPRTPVQPFEIPDGVELIEIITGGTVIHPAPDGKVYRKGSIFWHHKGDKTIFCTPPDDPYRCLALSFNTDGSPRPFSRISQWGRGPELNVFVADMLDFANRKILQKEEVLLYALGSVLRQRIKSPGLPRPLAAVCRKVAENPAANWTIEEMAHHAGVSSSRLFALFKMHLNISPHQYLLERKISMAKELLVSRRDIPIKLIVEMCGFFSLEVFYRHFKEYCGKTPAEFRAGR